jgi:hypothetical protein
MAIPQVIFAFGFSICFCVYMHWMVLQKKIVAFGQMDIG